jgi:hypothetical protein
MPAALMQTRRDAMKELCPFASTADGQRNGTHGLTAVAFRDPALTEQDTVAHVEQRVVNELAVAGVVARSRSLPACARRTIRRPSFSVAV